MEKLKMHTPNFAEDNIAKLAALFPGCVTESTDKNGHLKKSIDFDQLKQELSSHIVEGPQERYHLNWPGKSEALLTANAPIAKTLRPCREESVDFDTTENLFIEGDNLDALKLLQETYLGKVKMIYIDPPYNTGNDFIYSDKFAESTEDYLLGSGQKDKQGNRLIANSESNGRFHSDWLSMMYSRLKLARNLLKDEGVIFISIDDGEVSNLRKVCDEVFGSDNFVESFVWKKSYGGGPKERYAVTQHEYVLLYTKSISELPVFSLRYDSSKIDRYYKHRDQNYTVRGPYRLKPLEATKSMDSRPNLVYSIPSPNGGDIFPKRQWLWGKERVLRALENNELEFIKTAKGETLNYKQYLRDEQGKERGEKPFSIVDGIYTQKGTEDLRAIFDGKVLLQFPKPVELLSKFVEIGCPPTEDAIIIDFFSGSATTAQAAMKLNVEDGAKRKFIMIQLPELCNEKSEAFRAGYKTIAEIGKERIRRAGARIKDELGSLKDEKKEKGKNSLFSDSATRSSYLIPHPLDTGFRVLKIDSSNMADIYYTPDGVDQKQLSLLTDNIKADRSPEDLLFQVLLDWGVDLTLPINKETIEGCEVFFVDNNALAACFAKNGQITEEFCKEFAKRQPYRVVFRDAGFKNDSTKINVEQIFKLMSPHTEVKTI